MAAFDGSMESTADTTPLESTLLRNESRNGTKISDGGNQVDILEISQKNAPSDYKYCLTLVPIEAVEILKCICKEKNLLQEQKHPNQHEIRFLCIG